MEQNVRDDFFNKRLTSHCHCTGPRHALHCTVLYLSYNDSKANSPFTCWYDKLDMATGKKDEIYSGNISSISLPGNKRYLIICTRHSKLGVCNWLSICIQWNSWFKWTAKDSNTHHLAINGKRPNILNAAITLPLILATTDQGKTGNAETSSTKTTHVANTHNAHKSGNDQRVLLTFSNQVYTSDIWGPYLLELRFYQTFQFLRRPPPPKSKQFLELYSPVQSDTFTISTGQLTCSRTRIHTFLCLHSSGGHIQNTDIQSYSTYEEL